MVVEPTSVALKLAPKLAPLGKKAIRVLLGLNDVVRLFAHVERDVKNSRAIPSGKHELIWKRFDGQRADPDVLSALNAYLTRGDFAAARAKLQVRLSEVLRFEDPAIDDGRVVDLVVRSIEDNLSKAPLKDRDAMRLELALTRIPELGLFSAVR